MSQVNTQPVHMTQIRQIYAQASQADINIGSNSNHWSKYIHVLTKSANMEIATNNIQTWTKSNAQHSISHSTDEASAW